MEKIIAEQIIQELKNKIYDQEIQYRRLMDLIDNLPGDIYWKDLNFIWIGLNKNCARNLQKMGFIQSNRIEEVIGKTDLQIFNESSAAIYRKNDLEVTNKKIEISCEETTFLPTGEEITLLSIKRPLIDKDGNIIGVAGNTIDITKQKNLETALKQSKQAAENALQAMELAQAEEQKLRVTAEQLEIQNAIHKTQIDAQTEFRKMVAQVVHDVTSPITSLRTILQECFELPEKKRIDLRRAVERILDITNNLLNQYRPIEEGKTNQDEIKQPALLSATLIELLSEKKYQHQNIPVEFIPEFSQTSQFAFINVQLSALKRAISNLINNAVQALDAHPGTVYLQLDANDEWMHISVQDNGKGMNQETIDKIKNKTAFTEGKKEGHGIGLTQIMDTLERNLGSLNIESKLGKGSTFTITFSRLSTPTWCAEKITLTTQSLIIVLDDDPSIHGAWDVRFQTVLQKYPTIRLHNFEVGQEALDFIHSLNTEDKRNLILLTDYELLNQPINGLDVIKASQITGAILVTSHYINPDIRNQATSLNTKVLPKQLASHIPIIIVEPQKKYTTEDLKAIDAVWLDDDQEFTSRYEKNLAEHKKKVDMYRTPKELMDNIHIYPKNTPIFLDNNFEEPFNDIAGTEIAKQLHDAGYTNLFLITGNRLNQNDFSYVKILAKRDVESLLEYLK